MQVKSLWAHAMLSKSDASSQASRAFNQDEICKSRWFKQWGKNWRWQGHGSGTGTCWTTPMVRSSLQIGHYTGFGHFLNASLGIQLVKPRSTTSCHLLPCEDKLAAIWMDIGLVWDPKYHYHLDLTNTVPIQEKLLRLHPKEEAWLDVHLDELVAKGVIGPILPGEQKWCITLLLLVPGIQSGQPYWVWQNIVPVNKWMDKYKYELNDMRQFWAQLGRAKWISMLDLKAGFHNILFESTSSYDLAFVTYQGKF